MILNRKRIPDVGRVPHDMLVSLLTNHLMVPWSEATLNRQAPYLRELKWRLKNKESCRDVHYALRTQVFLLAAEIPTDKSPTVYFVFADVLGLEPATYTKSEHKKLFEELTALCW